MISLFVIWGEGYVRTIVYIYTYLFRWQLLDEIFLMKPEEYKYMRNGSVKIPGVQDENDFEDTREAMDIMLMTSDEQLGESRSLACNNNSNIIVF